MKTFRPVRLISLVLIALAALTSCKLDINAMRQDTWSKISGAERIFFLENIASTTIDTNLSALAREAAQSGYVQIMRYLQSRGADLNQADENGWSPILMAAARGDLPMIRFLVENAGADIRAKNNSRTTTLMLAARSGNLELCRYLLDRGTNVDAKSQHGISALMYGASSGNLDLVKLLVERGADTQVNDSFGNNALAYTTTIAIRDYLSGLGLK